jgi:ankyrin repeat protein
MLEMGADINNAKNANVETPLHYAVGANTMDCALFLVEHKANVNIANR